jgi:hypothetical protein
LEREEIWNKWKNEGCPNYVKEKITPAQPKPKRPRPNTSDFIIKNASRRQNQNTQSVVARLCNINHDNLEACKDPMRQFLPSLKEYFEEPIDQLDPDNQVEKQYQLIYQTDWAWKSLRLLAKRSPLYFMQNQAVKPVSEFLESICTKLGKEFVSAEQSAGTNGIGNQKDQINDAVNSPAVESHHQDSNGGMPEDEQNTNQKEEEEQTIEQQDRQNEPDYDDELSVKKEKTDNDMNYEDGNDNSQADEDADFNNDEQNTTMNASINQNNDKQIEMNDVEEEYAENAAKKESEIKNQPNVVVKREPGNYSNIVRKEMDSEIINFVSDLISSIDLLNKLAKKLDFDHLKIIDGDQTLLDNVKLASRKILQSWTVSVLKKSF